MGSSLNFNFYNILIFSGVVYGIVFSISTYYKIKTQASKAAYFLILTVLFLTLSNLQYWLIDIGLKDKYNIPDIVYIQFELLIVPFFYLFVKAFLLNKVSNRLIVLILTPFVFGMLYQVMTNSFKISTETLKRFNFIAELITIGYNFVLIGLLIKDIFIYEKKEKDFRSQKINPHTKWLKLILLLGFLICVLWLVGTQFFYVDSTDSLKVYYPLWISISVLIYWMGYKGTVELQLIADRKGIRKKALATVPKNKINVNNKSKLLYKDIEQYIHAEKLYLDSTISLQTIADEFNISSGYMSKLINQNSKFNFNDFINNLRIETAKKMLLDESFNKYTIHAIALESGFKTKSSFYTAFKKFTGTTPKAYKKQTNVSGIMN